MVSRREALAMGAAFPVSGLFLASAGGQVPQQPAAGQSLGEDPILACCLLIDGRTQTEICGWAKEKTKNDEVKKFIQAEIEAHEKLKGDLRQLGFEYPAAPQFPQGTQPQVGPNAPRMLATGRLLLPPGLAEAVQLAHEIAEVMLTSAKKGLEKKATQGAQKFDKAFVGAQLMCHLGELDKLQVFEKHATERMRQILHECRPVCERQIATLERIMQKLEGGSGTGARPDDS